MLWRVIGQSRLVSPSLTSVSLQQVKQLYGVQMHLEGLSQLYASLDCTGGFSFHYPTSASLLCGLVIEQFKPSDVS